MAYWHCFEQFLSATEQFASQPMMPFVWSQDKRPPTASSPCASLLNTGELESVLGLFKSHSAVGSQGEVPTYISYQSKVWMNLAIDGFSLILMCIYIVDSHWCRKSYVWMHMGLYSKQNKCEIMQAFFKFCIRSTTILHINHIWYYFTTVLSAT